MGFLSRFFGGKKEPLPGPAEADCVHSALVPHWDSAEDIGNPEKVDRYTCESCHQSFSREEGQQMIATEAERLPAAAAAEGEPPEEKPAPQ